MENIAYGYASDVLLQNGAPNASSLLTDIACLERNLQVNLYCLLDLSIHYYGASRQDVYRSLAAFGISDQATADAIYDYIRTEPTTYLKYYLGYLEILALRDKAAELWGDDYTPQRFHTFLLQAGPSDFTSLEKSWRKHQRSKPHCPIWKRRKNWPAVKLSRFTFQQNYDKNAL